MHSSGCGSWRERWTRSRHSSRIVRAWPLLAPGNAIFRSARSARALETLARRPRQVGIAMNRAQLDHLIRAAATIADDDEIVIVGSQSVLGQHPDAPAGFLASMKADLYPRNHAERWDLIDGSIGDGIPLSLDLW